MNFDEIRWIDFHDIIDNRGRLTSIEESIHTPFKLKRVFFVHQVETDTARGGHAHHDTDQVISAINGSLTINVSDGTKSKTFELDSPDRGVYVPRMFWVDLYDFKDNCVCMVLASTHYDMKKSYRTWEEYLHSQNLTGLEPSA